MSYELVKKSFAKMQSFKPLWEECERMYQSEHSEKYLTLAKEQNRNHIFIPLTYSTINIANSTFCNAFFANGNPIELLNVGEDDKELRDELKILVDYFFKNSNPFVPLSSAFLNACIYGFGAVSVYWEDEKVKTVNIPVDSLAFDFEADSFEDNRYIAHSFTQTIQEIKQRFKSGFYTLKDGDYLDFLHDSSNSYARKKVYEIYEKKNKGYELISYIDAKEVRRKRFNRCPIKHGILLYKLRSVNESKRAKDVACVGDSLARVIKSLNDELNVKRNQRMDLIERHLNPEIYIPVGAGLDSEDALRMGGYKYCDSTAGILFAPNGVGAAEFVNDVQMLLKDIEDVSAINGVMRGLTNASDRRSATAIQTVSVNSTARLESMIRLINETLFEPWAKDFVRLVYLNVSDEVASKILEKQKPKIGKYGLRKELDFNININFGNTLNKDKKIADLTGIIQMVGSNGGANLNGVMEEIIKLSLGENVDAKKILSGGKTDEQSGDEVVGEALENTL